MISLLEVVRNGARKINAKRIVLDPISLLLAQYPDDAQRRKALLDVVESMAETGARSVGDMGAVMKAVMPKTKGAADGKLVNDIVKELLGGK
jgi:uncharacterized protein YqeY